MPKIFLIAAALMLLASAGLGFVNKGKIAAKQDELVNTRKTAAAAQADATSSKAKQKKAREGSERLRGEKRRSPGPTDGGDDPGHHPQRAGGRGEKER